MTPRMLDKEQKVESSSQQQFSMLDPRTQTANDRAFEADMEQYFTSSLGTNVTKLRNFAKYVPRQILAKFLARHELFEHILRIHGQILECGVLLGGGLMTWAQLSAIYEPVNHNRRIVGFDTFSGFPKLSEKDSGDSLDYAKPHGLSCPAYDDLRESTRLYDLNRPVGHIPRVELVVGDAMQTIPDYVANNPHLVVALLYLDFDLYEPTKLALETFVPRMPQGAILAFDQLNHSAWPGETLAVLETIGLRNLKIQCFPTAPPMSYAILQ
jgi:hypothetical protein